MKLLTIPTSIDNIDVRQWETFDLFLTVRRAPGVTLVNSSQLSNLFVFRIE